MVLCTGSQDERTYNLSEVNEDDTFTDEDKNYLAMIQRMQSNYVDRQYLSENRRQLFYGVGQENGQSEPFKINLNAVTTTLLTFNKIYRQLIDLGMLMLIQPEQKLTLNNLRLYYIYSSRLYFLDKFFWSAMFAPLDEIFYREAQDGADSDAWKEVERRTQVVILADKDKMHKNL